MSRDHVYRPPRGNRALALAVIVGGGFFFTFLVFYVIPLMQKLDQGKVEDRQELVADISVDPPDEYEALEEEPPPEDKAEEPPQLAEAEESLGIEPIDLPDLGVGTGGRVLLNVTPTVDVGGEEEGFEGGEIDQEPTASSSFDPTVPAGVRKQLASQGAVEVVVGGLVDENGVVVETSIKRSSGMAALDLAAMQALKRWKFKPAIRNGRRARAEINQPFTFRVR